MKILLVSTLKRRVGENVTASRSRIIYEIALGLSKKGNEVSLLGTGDSEVSGVRIIPILPKAFVDLPPAENPFYAETSHLVRLSKKIEEISSDYDVIHNHTYPEFINLMALSNIKTPMVTTVHAQATSELDDVLSTFTDANLISISESHKSEFLKTKFYKRIYNGIDTNIFSYEKEKDDYLLWIGRLSKSKKENGEYFDPKGVKWAIKLAQATNERLLITGNVEDPKFYELEVKPHLNDKIKWVGPISVEQKLKREEVADLMKKAKVFLMTINWKEPFGLVMAEAMSCGTPVIGFDRGAVSEVIADGKTGYVVDPDTGVDGLRDALSKIDSISSEDCRQHVEDNFSIETMVKNYEDAYKELIN